MKNQLKDIESERDSVIKERDKLEYVLGNKNASSKVSPIQKTLMYSQSDIMANYIYILNRRIEEWNN